MSKKIKGNCKARINGEYLKIASESVLFGNIKDEYIIFDFKVDGYPKDKYIIFTVKMEFKEDDGHTRTCYKVDDDNEGALIITVYNSNSNELLISNMQKIFDDGDKDFYISHKIHSNSAGLKEVLMELYVK